MRLVSSTILVLCLIINIINANQVPVLSYFKSNTNDEITIGQKLESQSFIENLKKNLQSSNLELIVVDQLKSEDISTQLSKFDFGKNVHFEPQVESPYSSLESFLSENGNLKVNKHKADDVNQALVLFDQLLQKLSSSAVILTGKNRNVRRTRRDTENQEETYTNNTAYIYGKECAAYFDEIYYIDQGSSQTNRQPVHLEIDDTESTFDCDSNSTSTLMIKFNPNSQLKEQKLNSMK
jgi:hypothetical protein